VTGRSVNVTTKGSLMYGLIIQVKVARDCDGEMRAMIDDEVVPNARQLPGFVGGSWFRSLQGNGAIAVILFDSEEAACEVAQLVGTRRVLADTPAWSVYAIGTYEVIAEA
jgi:hypothetical protein